jgi:hypothetical protein
MIGSDSIRTDHAPEAASARRSIGNTAACSLHYKTARYYHRGLATP